MEVLDRDPVIEANHTEEPSVTAALTPGPTMVGPKKKLGEPKGKDLMVENFAEILSSNPGAAALGLTRKTAKEIQEFALEYLKNKKMAKTEASQEDEDVKTVKLLEQEKLQNENIRASKIPEYNTPAITLSEKVFMEIRQSFEKLERDHTVSRPFPITLFISSSPQVLTRIIYSSRHFYRTLGRF